MFLRRFRRRCRDKVHTYWALVESFRTARGSRQRVVCYLGELKPGEQSGWQRLGDNLQGKPPPSPGLFDPPVPADPVPDVAVVLPKKVRLENLRAFGDVWLALGLWRLLELDVFLAQRLPAGREQVPWALVAAILVVARLCRPQSELHIEQVWYRGTALEDLLGVAADKIHTDRLYQCMDWLLPQKAALEKHLKNRLGELFAPSYELLLYDITSTYFHGEARKNPLAARGYSRDSRPDCLQICLGLVVAPDGLPLGYEVFAGNRQDATTLEDIVTKMEAKYGRSQRVWVMDRGIVSEKNLAYLRDRQGSYIVGTPKAQLRHFEAQMVDHTAWQEVQNGVEVKLVQGPTGPDKFILARSAARQAKERAQTDRFVRRVEEGLQRMQRSMASGRLKDKDQAQLRLGRLLQRNWRASRAFVVSIEALPAPEPPRKAVLELTYRANEQWTQYRSCAEGCYLLRTNLVDLDAATLWKRYIQLTDVEWAFRITKDELQIRPIWHQKEERVKGHILICFLAYVLWKTLEQWMQRSGLGDAPRPLIEEMAKIQSGDVVLPLHEPTGCSDRELRLRCVMEPDEAQKVLLNRLGLSLPRRLKAELRG
jgi:transposase